MDASDLAPNVAPAGHYGAVTTFLSTLDEMSIDDRQTAALGLLNRIDPDDFGPLRSLLLALVDLFIADGVIFDFDNKTSPTGLSVLHLRRLIELREDAEQRIAIAAYHVQPTDLAVLFSGIEREAQAALRH